MVVIAEANRYLLNADFRLEETEEETIKEDDITSRTPVIDKAIIR